MQQGNDFVRTTSTLAIVSLISGILGLTFLPTIGSIVAIITGYLAKSEINKSHGKIDGNGMATAGLILGYLNLLIICVVFCVLISIPAFGWFFGDTIIQNF